MLRQFLTAAPFCDKAFFIARDYKLFLLKSKRTGEHKLSRSRKGGKATQKGLVTQSRTRTSAGASLATALAKAGFFAKAVGGQFLFLLGG